MSLAPWRKTTSPLQECNQYWVYTYYSYFPLRARDIKNDVTGKKAVIKPNLISNGVALSLLPQNPSYTFFSGLTTSFSLHPALAQSYLRAPIMFTNIHWKWEGWRVRGGVVVRASWQEGEVALILRWIKQAHAEDTVLRHCLYESLMRFLRLS